MSEGAWTVGMVFLAFLAAYCVWDLQRMRRESAQLLREAREHLGQTLKDRIEAERLLGEAMAMHANAVAVNGDAVRRWLRVVSTESRVH
jgi:hypothetical protein